MEKIHGIHHVFRGLGDPAALVYEAIEWGRHSPTSADIVRSTGISRSAVESALSEMTALGMIHRAGRQMAHHSYGKPRPSCDPLGCHPRRLGPDQPAPQTASSMARLP
jgi:hypothetical protein